jgi:hypothetical protein
MEATEFLLRRSNCCCTGYKLATRSDSVSYRNEATETRIPPIIEIRSMQWCTELPKLNVGVWNERVWQGTKTPRDQIMRLSSVATVRLKSECIMQKKHFE